MLARKLHFRSVENRYEKCRAPIVLKFIKLVFLASVVLGVLSVGFLHFYVLEGSPRVATMVRPEPEDVKATRDFVKSVEQKLAVDDEIYSTLKITSEQLESIAKLGARFTKDYRGTFNVGQSVVVGQFSVPVPWIGGDRWLNVMGIVPEFEDGFTAQEIRVGGLNVPPSLALFMMRLGGNIVVGDSFGTKILSIPQTMAINEDEISFDVYMGSVGQNGLFSGVFSSLRGQKLPSNREIQSIQDLLIGAMFDGTLSTEGSFLPYLRFVLEDVANKSSEENLANTFTAGMLALAKVCGAGDFGLVVSGIKFDQEAVRAVERCSDVTLNGRVDSRRHFITAAAIQAVSNRGYSVTVGELKELHDTISAGGFDFSDLSANNSGIRLADFVMSNEVSALRTLIDGLDSENSVIIAFDEIPVILSRQDFEDIYGDIDSSEYKEMLAFIEGKIDLLPIYQ